MLGLQDEDLLGFGHVSSGAGSACSAGGARGLGTQLVMQQSGGGRRLLTSRTARPGGGCARARMRSLREEEKEGEGDCRGQAGRALFMADRAGRGLGSVPG